MVAQGQLMGVAGVDAAEQRLDLPVNDGRSDSGADELADGEIPERRRKRAVTLSFGEGDLLRIQHTERGRGVRGHPHQRAGRHRVQHTTRPDRRGHGRGMGEAVGQTDCAGQVGALGSPGQDRLGADVDGHPCHLGATKLSSRRIAAVQDHQVQIGVTLPQGPCGCQPTDAAADDGHPCCAHAASLPAS